MFSRVYKRFITIIMLTMAGISCLPVTVPDTNGIVPDKNISTQEKIATATVPQAGPIDDLLQDVNMILGRPTDTFISISLLSPTNRQIILNYGIESGKYTQKTNSIPLQADIPNNLEVIGLMPNTTYYYQVISGRYRSTEHTFHTQRSPGEEFIFTIDADPHNRDSRFNGDLYTLAMENARLDQPDFHINLGDTFMTEKIKAQTYAEAESTFKDMRPYLGIIGADSPIFLVNGNHEGELGWLLKSDNQGNLPLWSAQLRQQYYPGPVSGNFYSGSPSIDPVTGKARDGYYSWTWGDALFIVLDPFWYTTIKPKNENPGTNWVWTLGKEQYDWLKSTLETNQSSFKFVFIHHLVGGAGEARGGIEYANLYEWGGLNADGTYGFDEQRPGWEKPIHQVLVENGVNIVFHGHDHVFVKQELDGIVYQEVPQASNAEYNNTRLAKDYGYTLGTVFGSCGHLRITVSPAEVKVEYIRAFLPQDEKSDQINGQVEYTYAITGKNH